MSARSANMKGAPVRLDAGYFERLFSGAGLAVFACDLSGRILAWNALGEQLFSQEGDSPGDADLRAVLRERDRAVFDEHLRSLVESLEPLEFRTRIEHGTDQTEYAVWLAPVIDDDGVMRTASVWFHDITARVQLRRAMRKRERLTTLGAMSGSVAHHYNNLLCSIATSLEYALNMNTMTATRRALRRTADAVGRATQLTQQLLAFAQADHRLQDVADLTETVLYYFDENEALFRKHGVRLELSWDPLPTIEVIREQLLIVIRNLVANALDVTPRGGTIQVTLTRHDENFAVLAITDSGPGIRPDQMDRLFEPFFTTKGELGDGAEHRAGMGLAVAHGLISEMHGSILASNAPSGGARFEVRIPIGSAAAPNPGSA